MFFENVIYQKTLKSRQESGDPSQEIATILYVTREANFWAVFIHSHEGISLVHLERFNQNKAIEIGVTYTKQMSPETPVS